MNIIIEQFQGGWRAYKEGNEHLWAWGETTHEALGKWVMLYAWVKGWSMTVNT